MSDSEPVRARVLCREGDHYGVVVDRSGPFGRSRIEAGESRLHLMEVAQLIFEGAEVLSGPLEVPVSIYLTAVEGQGLATALLEAPVLAASGGEGAGGAGSGPDGSGPDGSGGAAAGPEGSGRAAAGPDGSGGAAAGPGTPGEATRESAPHPPMTLAARGRYLVTAIRRAHGRRGMLTHLELKDRTRPELCGLVSVPEVIGRLLQPPGATLVVAKGEALLPVVIRLTTHAENQHENDLIGLPGCKAKWGQLDEALG